MDKIRMVRRPSDQFWSYRIYRADGALLFKSTEWTADRDYTWRRACVAFDQYVLGL